MWSTVHESPTAYAAEMEAFQPPDPAQPVKFEQRAVFPVRKS
jgi:hypothetical protein